MKWWRFASHSVKLHHKLPSVGVHSAPSTPLSTRKLSKRLEAFHILYAPSSLQKYLNSLPTFDRSFWSQTEKWLALENQMNSSTRILIFAHLGRMLIESWIHLTNRRKIIRNSREVSTTWVIIIIVNTIMWKMTTWLWRSTRQWNMAIRVGKKGNWYEV